MPEKANILIVGDESVCRTIGDILRADYEVKTAQTELEVVEQVRKVPFNLAILGNEFSDTGDIKLLNTIKEISPKIRVIVLTTHATVEDLAEAVEKNISAYISKPPDANEVKAIIKEVLKKQSHGVEIFRGKVRAYRGFVAIIGEESETFQHWLTKRERKYRDREVRVILMAGRRK